MSRKNCKHPFFLLGLVLIPILLFCYLKLAPRNNPALYNRIKLLKGVSLDGKQEETSEDFQSHSYVNESRWIVITSVAALPTKAIQALAGEAGWRMVIVGDTKGPKEPLAEEWRRLGSHVEVLTVERQKKLNYSILAVLPYKSYTRKMIGYLYAIERGAEWIYDTDDDNRPIGHGLGQFDYRENSYGMIYRPANVSSESRSLQDSVFNPYAFFGRPDMWPRGFPLTQLRTTNKDINQLLCSSMPPAAVQQGLVAQDPDMDAIYRLIHADPSKGLDEKFDSNAPPIVLAPGVFSPFNSQNTLFHRDAFFTMALPTGVAFRVTDIWRGYFAQKLLHMVGRSIGFYPVNAVQDRNPHNYLDDFKDEEALYDDADRMVEELVRFRCSLRSTEFCILELSELFVEKRFWTEKDHQLVRLWLKDLELIGYDLPPLKQDFFDFASCRQAALVFEPARESLNTKKHNDMKELITWCNPALKKKDRFVPNVIVDGVKLPEAVEKLKRLLLVVTFNYKMGPPMAVLQRMYEGYFAHVVYCGPFESFAHLYTSHSEFPTRRRMSFIRLSEEEMHQGYFAYACTLKAIEMRIQNIDGYVTLADDCVFNLWNPFKTNRFRLRSAENRPNCYWLVGEYGISAVKRVVLEYENATLHSPESELGQAVLWYDRQLQGRGNEILLNNRVWAVSDFYYLPKEHEQRFRVLGNVMLKEKVFHEIAVSRLAAPMGWLPFFVNNALSDQPDSMLLYGDRRKKYHELYKDNLLYLHPVKLSYTADLTGRATFCQSIVQAFVRNLLGERDNMTSEIMDQSTVPSRV